MPPPKLTLRHKPAEPKPKPKPKPKLQPATAQEMERVTTRLPPELFANVLQFMPYQQYTGLRNDFGAAARQLQAAEIKKHQEKFGEIAIYMERLIAEPTRDVPLVGTVEVHLKDGKVYTYLRQLSNDPFAVRVLGGPDQIRLLIKKYPEDGGSFSPDLYGLDVRHIMNELQLIIESILNIDHVVYTITDPLNG